MTARGTKRMTEKEFNFLIRELETKTPKQIAAEWTINERTVRIVRHTKTWTGYKAYRSAEAAKRRRAAEVTKVKVVDSPVKLKPAEEIPVRTRDQEEVLAFIDEHRPTKRWWEFWK